MAALLSRKDWIQLAKAKGALAAGETSGNLGMYLGLGVKDDIVEPENEICE